MAVVSFLQIGEKSGLQASHLSGACLPVALAWIIRSRKTVELADKEGYN